jgi:outer membrane receptor protein involved in Fe transport
MTYLISILLVLATATVSANGQQPGGVSGVIRDSMGLPIEGVEVALTGPSGMVRATTAKDGAYQFQMLEAGEYQLRCVKNGFRESIRGVDIEAGGTLAMDVTMQAGYAETVVVTASRAPESLITAPASVAVIGTQEIEASAADNFADLMRGVPGVNIVQFGARDLNVNTRGSTGILANSMLVMVDGRTVYQPLYGAVYWDLMTVTKDEVAQIEVLRTPASALWGANALSGVVNFRTKSPRQMTGFHGLAGVGERGTKTLNATWADATPGYSYKISGSYFEQDAWDRDNLMPDGSPMPPFVVFANRGSKQPKVDARIDWDANPRHVWSLRGGLAGAYGLIHSALGPGEFEDGSFYSYLELDHQSENFDVKVYWNRLDAPFRIVLFGLDEDAVNDTYVADVTRRWNVRSQHHLTVGGSVRQDRFDITIAPADRGRFDAAAFVEDQITLGPTVNVVAGARIDKFDTTDAVFAPRVGVVFSPQPSHSIRVAYNRAYRAPSLLENFVDITLPAVVPLNPPFFYTQLSLGSSELEVEKQDAVEVGYTGVLNSHTTFLATVYNQRIKNNIWFLPVSFYGPGAPPPGWPLDPATVPLLPHVFSFINLGSVRDRGIELAVHADWPRVALQGSYTFQADPKLDSGTNLPLQINKPSRHQAGGGVTYTANRWTAATDVQYTDRAFWADVLTEPFWGYTDSYVNVNARGTYRLRGQPWEFWVSATDLLDQKIKSHVFGDTIRRKVTAGIRWAL